MNIIPTARSPAARFCWLLLLVILAGAFEGPDLTAAVRPPSSNEPIRLSPEREKELGDFLMSVGQKAGLTLPTLQEQPPGAGAPYYMRLGFSNRGQITDFKQWPNVTAGLLMIGPRSVQDPFDLETWQKKDEIETLEINGQPALGIQNRPHGGLGIISVGGKRLTHSAPVGYWVHIYGVTWKRNGWKLASVYQGYSKAGENKIDAIKQAAIKNAELLDRMLSSGQAPPIAIDMLDANPLFGGDEYFHILGSGQWKKLATCSIRRAGAAADGTSLLLLRLPVAAAGSVTFKLSGPEATGQLLNITEAPPRDAGSDGRREMQVPTVEVERKHYGFVLYCPPAEFGGANVAKASLRFQVTASWVPDKANPRAFEPVNGEQSIEIVRPPIVLVHGTYDNPQNCWRDLQPSADAKITMFDRLVAEHFDVFTVDYEASNGSSKSGPSHFTDNDHVVMNNRGGIWDALKHMRGECPVNCSFHHGQEATKRSTYAATQVYLVAHSLGGIVTRTYARGKPLMEGPPPAEHFDPNRVLCPKCWYHRANNFFKGDINRMITLSSTHKGSDLSGIISVMKEVRDDRFKPLYPVLAETAALMWAVNGETGMDTGAFEDQVPNSPALNAIGPTAIPAHALACVNDDADLDNLYAKRLQKIWGLSPNFVLDQAFTRLGQKQDAEDLFRLMNEYGIVRRDARLAEALNPFSTGPSPLRMPELLKEYPILRAPLRMRAATFGNDLNDCTVRMESSHGGLKEPYISVMTHCLHGYAPAYTKVQDRVVELLRGTQTAFKFCPTGFPPAGGPVQVHPPDPKWAGLYDNTPVVPKRNDPSNINTAGGNGNTNNNGNANGNPRGGNVNSNRNDTSGGAAGGNPIPALNPPPPVLVPRVPEAGVRDSGGVRGVPNPNSSVNSNVPPLRPHNGNSNIGTGGGDERFMKVPTIPQPPAPGRRPNLNLRPALAADPLVTKALRGVSDDPDNPRNYAFLGALLLGKHEWKDAEAAFREAIRLEPANPTHRSNLSNLFASRGDWSNAETVMQEAIRMDPQTGAYRLQLGGLFAMQQRWPDATAAYREAIRLQPDSHQAQHALGRALLSQKKWMDAAAAFNQAATLQPDRATYHIDLGVALLGAEKWRDAEGAFNRAIQLRASDAPGHAHRATTLIRQGRREEAKKSAEEAIRLGLKSHPVYGELGLVP